MRHGAWILVGVAACGAACSTLFGDYTVVDDASGSGAGPAGASSSGSTTASGTTGTSGTGGQACTIDGMQDGTKTDVDCGGAACDAQGHTCAFGKKCLADTDCATGYCNGATCDAQTIGPGPVVAIAVDATNVYWAGGTTIVKAPVGGGATTTLAEFVDSATGIALDATHVYWTDDVLGTVNAVPLAGGNSMTLLTLPKPAGPPSVPSGIVVDVTTIYFGWVGGVSAMPITGGMSTGVAMDMDSPIRLAQDTMNVYWSDGDEVWGVPKGGGLSTFLVNGGPNVAVDATSVYSATPGSSTTPTGNIVKAPTAGGATSTLAFNQNQPVALAVDDANVYWANAGDGTVMRVPTGGGTATLLASGQGTSLTCIALDATSVYWGSSGATGVVKKVLK